MKKPATKQEREHLQRIKSLRCIINNAECHGVTEVHHIDIKLGMAKNHYKVIPLCQAHHRNGSYGIAFHATGKKVWEQKYGTEHALLNRLETPNGISGA